MLQLSSFDLHFLVEEMQSLKSGRVNKVYQDKNCISFKMHTLKQDFFFNLVLPGVAFLSEDVKFSTKKPSSFCMTLRKFLSNAYIRDISQYNSERILVIELEKKEKFTLIIEFFNNGNVILLKEGKIIAISSHRNSAGRELKLKIDYEYPSGKVNAFTLKEPELKKILAKTEKETIVLSLASDLSLGGIYSEELLRRAKVDKTTLPKKVDSKIILKAFKSMLKEFSPGLLTTKKIHLTSIKLEGDYQGFESLSKAVEHFVLSDKPERVNPQKQKIERIVATQKLTIEKLKKDIVENGKKGELIYENYAFLQELLDTVEKKKLKMSLKEILETLEKHPKITIVDKKMGKVNIDL
jgi:predicted ribosome quality control (RQC) complex YloA/Tae2 family protein